jgi:hypothetical protein
MAFLSGTIHTIDTGTDLQNETARLVPVVLSVTVISTLVRKRIQVFCRWASTLRPAIAHISTPSIPPTPFPPHKQGGKGVGGIGLVDAASKAKASAKVRAYGARGWGLPAVVAVGMDNSKPPRGEGPYSSQTPHQFSQQFATRQASSGPFQGERGDVQPQKQVQALLRWPLTSARKAVIICV